MATWRSKLGTSYPRDLVERLDAEHHRTLKRLRQQPHNQRCAECEVAENTWASVNLGIFVCTRCADIHRAIGAHISKVKGCGGTYLWGPDEIAQMEAVGNKRAAELYCGKGAPRVARDASKEELMDYCQKKYDLKLWASPGSPIAAPAPTATPLQTTARREDSQQLRTPKAENVNLLDLDTFFDTHLDAHSSVGCKAPRAQGPVVDSIMDPLAVLKDASLEWPSSRMNPWPAPDAWPAPRASPASEMSSWPDPNSWPCKSDANDFMAWFGDGAAPASKAAAQAPARAWQPSAPESDDLWVDWGKW